MTPIERIQEMEGHLNTYQSLIEELEACLKRVEAGQSSYIALRDYYTSQVYMDDVELSNQPDFPEEVYCGVLSEDAVYDLLDEHYQKAVEMLDLATKMLKERQEHKKLRFSGVFRLKINSSEKLSLG